MSIFNSIKSEYKNRAAKSAILGTTGIVTVEAAVFLSVVTATLFMGLVVLRDDTNDILCDIVVKMRSYAGEDMTGYVCAVASVTGDEPITDTPQDPVVDDEPGDTGSSTEFTEFADTVDFTDPNTPMPFAGPQNALGGNDIVTLPSSLASATAYGFTSLSFDGGLGTDQVTITSTSASEVWKLSGVEVIDVGTSAGYQAISLNHRSPTLQIGDIEKIDISSAFPTILPVLDSAHADFASAPKGADTIQNYLHLYRGEFSNLAGVEFRPNVEHLKITTENIGKLIVKTGLTTAAQNVSLHFLEASGTPNEHGVYGDVARTAPMTLQNSGTGSLLAYLPDGTGDINYLNVSGSNVTLEGIRYRFGTIASGTRVNTLTGIALGGGAPSIAIEGSITPDAAGNRFISADPAARVSNGSGGYTVNGSEFQLYIEASVPTSTYRLNNFVIRSQADSDGSVTFAKNVSLAGAFPQAFYLNDALGYLDLLQEEVTDGTCSTSSTSKFKTVYGENVNAGFGICYNTFVTLSDGNTTNAIKPVYTLDVPPSAPANATTGFPDKLPVVLQMNDALSQTLTVSGEAVVATNSSNNADAISNRVNVTQTETGSAYDTRVMVYSSSSTALPDLIAFEPGASLYIANGSWDGTTCNRIRIQLPAGVTYDSLFVGGEIFSGDVLSGTRTISFGSSTYTAQGTEFMLAGSRFLLGGYNATRTGLSAISGPYTYYEAPPRTCFIDG